MSNTMDTKENGAHFRHCECETRKPVRGTVTGKIPSWLEGDLIRIGPGIKKVGEDKYNHIFDGLAIIHKFHIQNGQVLYQSQALASDAYKRNMEAQRIVVSEFGTMGHRDPCMTIFGRLKADFLAFTPFYKKSQMYNDMTDNCSVNLAFYGDQLFSMTESNFIRRIDPNNLNTIGGRTDLSDYVAINTASAHPHVLPDGTIINLGNIFRRATGPKYGVFKVSPKASPNSSESPFSSTKLIAEIPSRWKTTPAYFHSFGVTQTGKIVFIEAPYCLDLFKVVSGVLLKLSDATFSDCLKWKPNEKTRFYVVDIETGKVHKNIYETDKLFVFHHINAYEENGSIIVDVAGYDDANWVSQINSEDKSMIRDYGENPSARRYVLPLNETADIEGNFVSRIYGAACLTLGCDSIIDVKPQHLSEFVLDLPQINHSFNGRKYKYFYAIGQEPTEKSEFKINDMLYKVNVETNEKLNWKPDENSIISEPVFVANPNTDSDDEDDGVVLSVLLPLEKPKFAVLVVLNAKDLTKLGRANIKADGTVTGTLHGIWNPL